MSSYYWYIYHPVVNIISYDGHTCERDMSITKQLRYINLSNCVKTTVQATLGELRNGSAWRVPTNWLLTY